MTPSLAVLHLLAATKKSSSSILPLLILVGIALAGYFFFLKPQQRKAQAARAGAKSDIEVGDEVQTIGGVIGTVLEIHGDRYTLLTGSLGTDGNLDGLQPTRIVFIRQAIAKKIDPVVQPDDLGEHADHDETTHEGYGLPTDHDVEDEGPSDGDAHHGEEAEEA
ncbi:MAG TPA: preprotein translocase subunit YajC [Acidimicrobiales bacterium]|jgi:preprotein translocase subunit YajC|nr:preprotein translocase subunit YajC [Acidimicrobiales bacterium]